MNRYPYDRWIDGKMDDRYQSTSIGLRTEAQGLSGRVMCTWCQVPGRALRGSPGRVGLGWIRVVVDWIPCIRTSALSLVGVGRWLMLVSVQGSRTTDGLLVTMSVRALCALRLMMLILVVVRSAQGLEQYR
jgi:hypothetical protein